MAFSRFVRIKRGFPAIVVLVAVFTTCASPCQQISRLERERSEAMLGNIADDVRAHYYDPKLHNLDWDALVGQAKQNIAKASDTAAADAEIAALLEHLNDSHTSFLPIRKSFSVDYGFHFMMIGDRCFVTQVRRGSDAETQGMKPGDEVLTINGFKVDRPGIVKLHYALEVVVPLARVDVAVRELSGKILHLNVASEVKQQRMIWGVDNGGRDAWQQRLEAEKIMDREKAQITELGPDLAVLRIPYFLETDLAVENLLRKARGHKTLIVDLRGTPGGAMPSLVNYLENLFDRDIKLGDSVERDKKTPLTVKGGGRNAFRGDLIVLVDSETGSGAEMFARAVQIEERGTVMGDRTSGMVMESRVFRHAFGVDPYYVYGASVTVAEPIMSDGKSLERVGVLPDRSMLPTPADLAAGRDPVLAYAAELVGVKVSPEEAAKLFPRMGIR